MLFQWIPCSCGSLHMIKLNKPTVVSVQSAMVSQCCVSPTSKRWFLKIVQGSMKHDPFMPCRNPCRLYIHLAFTYSVGPSSVVWSEFGLAPPFPPMRVLEVYWSRALNLVCEMALSCHFHDIWVTHLRKVKLHPPSSIIRSTIHRAMTRLIFMHKVGKLEGGMCLWGAN